MWIWCKQRLQQAQTDYARKENPVTGEGGLSTAARVILEILVTRKILFVEPVEGDLSKSQFILEYLKARYPVKPMYPAVVIDSLKCRELISHVELNVEWVARRTYEAE